VTNVVINNLSRLKILLRMDTLTRIYFDWPACADYTSQWMPTCRTKK